MRKKLNNLFKYIILFSMRSNKIEQILEDLKMKSSNFKEYKNVFQKLKRTCHLYGEEIR